MEIFERASRCKLRFDSSIGDLTTEQLWDLDLTSKRGTSLDTIARAVHSELKGIDEVSFVDEKPNPRRTELTLQLDILKHVIEAKKNARLAAEKAALTAERKRKLYAALASKEDKELEGMTREQIEAEIANLAA